MRPASTPPPVQTARLINRIKSIANAGAVLHLGAHPDDEDSGMIAYMSRRHATRTVYWSATRGEGGQNRRGPERSEALGVVRTWESLDARRIDGGEVRYGPFYDFGFSKSGEDTLRRWGRQDVIREIVRAIRSVQPLVVVCRWSGGPTDGHGHHQAVGLVAEEAFDAAGDSRRFPELRLPPWRPEKLYRSVAGDWQPGEDGSFGTIVDEYERAGYLRIDTGEVDVLAGLTYQEQAHIAVNQHRSQGMGFVPEPGPYFYYYRLVRPARADTERETSFFDRLDPTLTGFADGPAAGWPVRDRLDAVCQAVRRAEHAFRPDKPSDSVPALFEAKAMLSAILGELPGSPLPPDSAAALDRYLAGRIIEVDDVIAVCAQLRAECLVDQARTTPGHDVSITVRVWCGGEPLAEVDEVELHRPEGWSAVRVDGVAGPSRPSAARPYEVAFRVTVPPDATPRAPYWLRSLRGPYRYEWPETSPALGHALDDPLVWASIAVHVDGQACELRTAAVHRSGFAGGSRVLPLTVLPPVALTPRQGREILPVTHRDAILELDVNVRCLELEGAQPTLSLLAPADWTVEPSTHELTFGGAIDTTTVRFRVVLPADARAGSHTLRYQLTVGDRASAFELNSVRLGSGSGPVDEDNCVAEAHLVRAAVVTVHLIDAAFVKTLRYGYVRGADEQILASLARFGLDISEMSDEDIEFSDLGSYDAIVIGPNAYRARQSVSRNAARLLAFVAQGGTLIVQHQTYGYDVDTFLPHPLQFHQPHDRVTDPEAEVVLLDPDHPVLQLPNKIGPADFDGWVHDRGMYFIGEWDRRYSPVLAAADMGEAPREGGLLTTAFGRGTYVYSGYSFHRQIPAGVAGAVRLFANLLGLAEVRVRERMARLAAIDLFAFMTESQLYQAARTVSERWVDANTYLARQGERGHEMFILVDGAIEVIKHTPGAADRVLHVAGPGEELGELTLLADIPRSASLRAASDAVVLVIRDDALHDWLQRHPDLAKGMLQRLAKRIVATGPAR